MSELWTAGAAPMPVSLGARRLAHSPVSRLAATVQVPVTSSVPAFA
jgi:hypothetical protein